MKHIYMAMVATFLGFNTVAQSVARFDELYLAPGKFWNGSDESGSFKSADITFYNSYNTDYKFWSGFAYSNTTDVTTAGFENQYSAITGGGNQGSSNFAVCYPSPTAEAAFTAVTKVTGLYVTNSTYAYWSMKNGDQFSKKFGGESGNDADYFKLMIEALNEEGKPVDTVYFYLADFRFADASKDYILNRWTWVDLTEMKEAQKLRFSLSSSDNSFGFMNTPSYFCLDDLNEVLTSSPAIEQLQAVVYPNPFDDQLTVSGLTSNAKISIYDISGRSVVEYTHVHNSESIKGLGGLKPGVYFVKVTEGMNQSTLKLVKR